MCFPAKLKGFKQRFKEGLLGCFQGLQGFKEGFFIKKGCGYAFKPSQTGLLTWVVLWLLGHWTIENMSPPGVEPGLSRPRRDVLTTRR